MRSETSFEGDITRVRVTADRDTTLPSHLGIVGQGVARCRDTDVYSQDIGQALALGRAIKHFGEQVEEAALARTVSLEEADRVLDLIWHELLIELGGEG